MDRFDELHRVRTDRTAAVLVLARELTDTGDRTGLNKAIADSGSTGSARASVEGFLGGYLQQPTGVAKEVRPRVRVRPWQ